jgi:hypothetical protein
VSTRRTGPEAHSATRLRAARWATRAQFLLFGAPAAIMLPNDYALLIALALLFGACIAQFDVAINAEGSEREALSVVALIGLAVVGVGLANVVPILFMAASRVPGVAPAQGIPAASSIGYLGMVVGPPLVGGIAHGSSLSWGLGVVVAGALLLAWGSRRIPV